MAKKATKKKPPNKPKPKPKSGPATKSSGPPRRKKRARGTMKERILDGVRRTGAGYCVLCSSRDVKKYFNQLIRTIDKMFDSGEIPTRHSYNWIAAELNDEFDNLAIRPKRVSEHFRHSEEFAHWLKK